MSFVSAVKVAESLLFFSNFIDDCINIYVLEKDLIELMKMLIYKRK